MILSRWNGTFFSKKLQEDSFREYRAYGLNAMKIFRNKKKYWICQQHFSFNHDNFMRLDKCFQFCLLTHQKHRSTTTEKIFFRNHFKRLS